MKATLNITVDGQPLTVPEGISVAAALALIGDPTTRQAVNGELRAPFCGMGVCQECRIAVDG
ncbi:TPA: (2Fe-2S)-binding protein, partial [Klebsiella pneumoniae]|nr:(2Fe-2S)-binding protein [Klebsiella pneumoniae]